jgi:hypothetical protein
LVGEAMAGRRHRLEFGDRIRNPRAQAGVGTTAVIVSDPLTNNPCYKFIVTGFTFHMFFGMMIPKPTRRICSARHGFLYMSEDRDSELLKTMAVMANRAEKKGKLRKEPQAV